jgi:hypothetical protein
MIKRRFSVLLAVAGVFIGMNANAQFITERSEALDAGDPSEHVPGQWSACDAITGLPIEASWHVRGLDPLKPLVFHESDLNGLYLIPWREYDRVVEAQGYMVAADHFWIDGQYEKAGAGAARDTVFLAPLDAGVRQELPTIHFAGSEITYDALPTLAAVERMLTSHPELELDIIGAAGGGLEHSPVPCARAGRDVARAVWEYLVTEGVHPGRLVVSGVPCAQAEAKEGAPEESNATESMIAVEVLAY